MSLRGRFCILLQGLMGRSLGRRRIVLGCRIVSPPSSHFLDLDLFVEFWLFAVWLDPDGFRAVSFLSLVFPGSGR